MSTTIDQKNIIFLVGDNMKTNRRLAREMNLPLIRCNSHKPSLAVSLYIGKDRDEEKAERKFTGVELLRRKLLHKVRKLMYKLKTNIGKAHLCNFTDLVAIRNNETRWDGNFRMIDRFLKIREALDTLI